MTRSDYTDDFQRMAQEASALQILITGGTGFIGSALCRHLTGNGHDVIVLSRNPEQVAAVCGSSVRGVGDLAELTPQEPVDAVVNLAGASIAQGRWSEARKRELVASRVQTTAKIIEFMAGRDQRPECLISASAVGYYGAQDDRELDEQAPPVLEFQHELCAQWEAEARKAEALGVRTAIIRLGIVLGPGGGALSNMLPPFRFGLGGPIGDGQQWMSWVHREDVLGAIETLLGNPQLSGPFNMTAPNPVRNAEFARTLGRTLRRPAFLPMPGFVLRILLGEFAHLLLTGQRVIPQRLGEAGYQFQHADLAGALADILQ